MGIRNEEEGLGIWNGRRWKKWGRERQEGYIVFQLKFPSYEILLRCGSFVKSTLSVNSSRPAKYSSKLGASRDNVAKTSPLGVR